VSDLASVVRGRVNYLEVHLAPCDPGAVVSAVVDEQQRMHPDRDFHVLLPRQVLAPVLADANRIWQVLSYFLTNAQRYTPAERPITIRVRQRSRQILVSVRDEGPGVPEDQRMRIWERF
jgi:signal transduction histidine kinase